MPGGDLHALWKPCKHLCLQPTKRSVATDVFFEKIYFYDDWILCGFSLADELYAWVDKRYGDMADSFGIAQSW